MRSYLLGGPPGEHRIVELQASPPTLLHRGGLLDFLVFPTPKSSSKIRSHWTALHLAELCCPLLSDHSDAGLWEM